MNDDLEDVRDVDPQRIMDSFMESINKQRAGNTPVKETKQTAEDFEELIN